MLSELRIKNLAIVDEAEIVFAPGFNVITGETGAGKSILIQSIQFLMGKRASSKDVRQGEREATLTARLMFQAGNSLLSDLLKAVGLDDEDMSGEIQIQRRISIDGKSKVTINGQNWTVSGLTQLAPHWIDMTGQHDQLRALDRQSYLNLLDEQGSYGDVLLRYRKIYGQYQVVCERIASFEKDQHAFERDRDYLQFQLAEIQKLELEDESEDALVLKIERLKHKEQLTQSLEKLAHLLAEESPLGASLEVLQKCLALTQKVDTKLLPYLEEVNAFQATLADLAHTVTSIGEGLEEDEDLDKLNQQLAGIQKLKRKYGSIKDILNEKKRIEALFHQFNDAEQSLKELGREEAKLSQQLLTLGNEIRKERLIIASRLQAEISRDLKKLGMAKAELRFQMNELAPGTFNINGIDELELLLSPNPGEGFKLLSDIASGGELSRIMLAVKSALMRGELHADKSFVFDEVDTGIGGETAERVGIHQRILSSGRQVLAVTHLAQVACYADRHIKVEKIEKQGRTVTRFDIIEDATREAELARMIGGIDMSEGVKAHARDLIQKKQHAFPKFREA